MDVLLVSQDADTRQQMALVVRSIERRVGEELRFRAARDGELGAKAAFRDRPDVIVADEIATRAGALRPRSNLRDALDPYTGVTRSSWSASTTPGSPGGRGRTHGS